MTTKNKLSKTACYFCHETDLAQLEIHHVDMDQTNNTAVNILTLCKHCHRGLHRRVYEVIFKTEVFERLGNTYAERMEKNRELRDYYNMKTGNVLGNLKPRK